MSTYDPIDLRGQEALKAEREAREKIARDLEDKDWRWLWSSPRGRRIIWRMLTQSRIFQSSFNTNALQMAFNEGFRNYGNWMLGKINALAPEIYPTMVKENLANVRSDDGNGQNSN